MLEMKLHDEEWFFVYTRMTPQLFETLVSLVAPHLTNHSIRKPLSPSQRLAITLRFLATGDSYFSIANSYHLGKSTVCVVLQEVLEVLWIILSPIIMPTPTTEDLWEIANGFLRRWDMPHCIGSVDGKHIRITAPAKSGSLYFNYKTYFSIVLLGVSDAAYNFTYVDIGAYGSISDGGVFSSSAFEQNLQNKTIPLPRSETLRGSDIVVFYFVGDAAFPLSENLVRPFSGQDLDIVKGVFNYRLSRDRRVIENIFGIMVARWRIYQREYIKEYIYHR